MCVHSQGCAALKLFPSACARFFLCAWAVAPSSYIVSCAVEVSRLCRACCVGVCAVLECTSLSCLHAVHRIVTCTVWRMFLISPLLIRSPL